MDPATLLIVSLMFLLLLFVLVLIVRYSNKRIVERIIELRKDLIRIEGLVKEAECRIDEKGALLEKIKSVEKELARYIKKEG